MSRAPVYGLVGSFRRARWLLRRFHNMTSPGARILAKTADPYETDVPEHLAYHRLNRRRSRMSGQLRIRIRYRTYATPYIDYLLVSRDEMAKIVDGTGWRIAKTIDESAYRYIAVLEKEATTWPAHNHGTKRSSMACTARCSGATFMRIARHRRPR